MAAKRASWSGWRWAFTAFMGIMLLHSLAILFFTRGFLLTRSELPQCSQCEDIAESPCFPPRHDQNANKSCWTKPVVDRLVIIVLDALRLTALRLYLCFILFFHIFVSYVYTRLFMRLSYCRFDFVAPSTFFHGKYFLELLLFSIVTLHHDGHFQAHILCDFRTLRLSSFVQLLHLKVFFFSIF